MERKVETEMETGMIWDDKLIKGVVVARHRRGRSWENVRRT